MLRPVDDAHAAAADPRLDPVAGDDRAEARVLGCVRHDAASMDDPALAGTRVLVAGDDRAAGGRRARGRLRAARQPVRPPARPIPRRSPRGGRRRAARRGARARRRAEAVAARGSTRSGSRTGPPVIALADLVGARRRSATARRAPAARARSSAARCARARPSSRRVVAAQALAAPARRRDRARSTRCDRLARPPSTATTTRTSTRSASAHLAARLARGLGLERPRRSALIRRAAPLHDLGKIAIPDSILLKPGRLTDEEFEVVKTHAVLGARVLAGGGSDLLRGRRADRPLTTTSAGTAAAIRTACAGDAIPVGGAARRTSPTSSTCSSTSGRTRSPGRSAGRGRDPRRRGHALRPGGRGGLRGARPGTLGRRLRVHLKPDAQVSGVFWR